VFEVLNRVGAPALPHEQARPLELGGRHGGARASRAHDLVEHGDRVRLLRSAESRGHLAGAGLDVWALEPPPAGHPLLALDNVIATHHIAGVTHQARRRMATMACSQLLGALRGERPPRLVNPEAWPPIRP